MKDVEENVVIENKFCWARKEETKGWDSKHKSGKEGQKWKGYLQSKVLM